MWKTRSNFIKENGIETVQGRDTFLSLAQQVQTEYELAWKHQKPKKDEWEVRLKLYNNQKRDKKAVGDTTMFTILQTVLASLYVDRLDATWEGKEEGDDEVAENLNALAKNDYDDMEKDVIDYEWDWDTCFFGRGLLALDEYVRDPDKGIFLPLPRVLDPITFLRDPFATSINGDRKRRGACRFYGYEVKMTKADMQDHPHMFSDIKFEELKYGSGSHSVLQDAVEARQQAQGLQSTTKQEMEAKLGANAQYDLTEWHTHYEIDGKVKKVKVWLANDRTKVVGMQVLKADYWKVIDRPLYPTAHDWDGTSIPDLTEDKQRARAIAQNLGLNAMKADLYPMYIYDSNKITNRKDLSFGFNKFIPVDKAGDTVANAMMPLIKARPNMQLLEFVYNSIDVSAQKATATPDIQQGIQSEKDRPLGETNLLASRVDTRYSLSAKVFGWSERRFWQYWYLEYKENFAEDIDEKILRIVGAFGAKWRPLTKKDITTKKIDPDVRIESRVLSRAKQLEERQSSMQFFGLALQEPTSNRRWGLKKLAKLHGYEKDEIDRLFPPTIDERIAEDQNDILNDNKFVEVLAEDDHNVHLEVHAKAKDTPATKAHIETHKKALSIKKTNPEFFPEDPMAAAFQPGQEGVLPVPTPDRRALAPSQTSATPS
jgi:hypothetical protein